MRDLPSGWEAIYAVVRRIPRGRVTTYGAVATLLGRSRGARQVGYALAALRGTRNDVPWQRALGARPRGKAAISILDPMGAGVQQAKLEQEGVRFDERGMVELRRYGWKRAAREPVGRPAARPPLTPRTPSARPRSRPRTGGWSGPRRTSRSGRG